MIKKSTLICMAFALLLTLVLPATTAFAGNVTVKFNNDGKFKVVVFADVQDTQFTNMFLLEGMNTVLDNEQPDMIILLGDQIEGWNPIMYIFADKEKSTLQAIDGIMQPIVSHGVPFAVTFGNHDSEKILSRDEQLAIYQTYPNCLSYDDDPSLAGAGTCNIPLYSSDGSHIALNFYMIDSLDYAKDGSYAAVTEEQIEWTKNKSEELAVQNGGQKVPSVVFQHIIVPEIYDYLTQATGGDENTFKGKAYGAGRVFSYDCEAFGTGGMLESPSPADESTGQFDAWLEQGDVMAAVFGHDHVNTFVIDCDGIELISAPGSTYTAYNSDETRGVRVLEFDENDVEAFTSRLIKYEDYYESSLPRDIWRYITSTTSMFFYSGIKMFIIPVLLIIILVVVLIAKSHNKHKRKRAEIGK